MKIATEDFARLTAACARIADERHAVPALRMVRLEASDYTLTAEASNGEYWLTLSAPCDGDLAPLLAPAHKLAEAVAKISADTLDVTAEGTALSIKAKGSRRKLQVAATDAFPDLPVIEAAQVGIEVDVLTRGFAFCAPFASEDKVTQAHLAGVFLHRRDGALRFAASDGNSLAVCGATGIEDIPDATVPSAFIVEIGKLGLEGVVTLLIGERKVGIVWDEGALYAPRVDGQFVDYMRIVPADTNADITFPADAMTRAAASVRPFGPTVGKFGAALAIQSEGDGIEVLAQSGDGEAIDHIEAELVGEVPRFGMSSAYLERACKAFGDERITIAMRDAVSPMLVRSATIDDRFIVIGPRRI